MINEKELLEIIEQKTEIGFIPTTDPGASYRKTNSYTRPVQNGVPTRYFQACMEIVNKPGIKMREIANVINKKYYYAGDNLRKAIMVALEPLRNEKRYLVTKKEYGYYPTVWMLNFVKEHINEVDVSFIPENL